MLEQTVNAMSWRVAVEVVRAMPSLAIVETHPGGGTYDCLTLAGDRIRVDINREGSIHISEGPRGEILGFLDHATWTRAVARNGGVRDVAEQVLGALDRQATSKPPPTTPRVLTYRVIARLLAAHVLDDPAWDARSQYLDTSGYGGGIVERVPCLEMAAIPARRLWRMLRGEHTVAWMWDGWAWTRSGERRDLMAAYSRGASIDQLVGIVTDPPTKRHARELPPVPDLPRQPTGWE